MSNAYWEPLDFELPPVPDTAASRWERWIDMAREAPEDIIDPPAEQMVIGAGIAWRRARSRLLVCIEDRSGPGVGGRGQGVATNAAKPLRLTRSGQAEKRRQDDKPRRHPLRALLKGSPPRVALRLARKPLAGVDNRSAHCCRMQHRRQNSLHRGR